VVEISELESIYRDGWLSIKKLNVRKRERERERERGGLDSVLSLGFWN